MCVVDLANEHNGVAGVDGTAANVLPARNDKKLNVRRRRWTDDELHLLFRTFGKDISKKVMPAGYQLAEFVNRMPHPKRTIAQVRTQVHNYIHGKIKH